MPGRGVRLPREARDHSLCLLWRWTVSELCLFLRLRLLGLYMFLRPYLLLRLYMFLRLRVFLRLDVFLRL